MLFKLSKVKLRVVLTWGPGCRYLIAEGEETIYVALMGTKLKSDLITNARVYQQLLWEDQHLEKVSQSFSHRFLQCLAS